MIIHLPVHFDSYLFAFAYDSPPAGAFCKLFACFYLCLSTCRLPMTLHLPVHFASCLVAFTNDSPLAGAFC
jgi:hypothetical protein